MQKNQKDNLYTKKENIKIYLLLDKRIKKFYISYMISNDFYKKFRTLMSLQNKATSQWIKTMREENVRPCFFILEELFISKSDAIRRVIAWISLLKLKGLINVDEGTFDTYSDDLYEDTIEIFDEIKNKNILSLINCNNCIIKKYSNYLCFSSKNNEEIKTENKKKKRELKVYLDEDEYNFITNEAKKNKQSSSNYVKNNSLNPKTIINDYSYLKDLNEAFGKFNYNTEMLIVSILSTSEYYSSDLEEVIELQKKIVVNQKKLKRKINKEQNKMYKDFFGDEKNDC